MSNCRLLFLFKRWARPRIDSLTWIQKLLQTQWKCSRENPNKEESWQQWSEKTHWMGLASRVCAGSCEKSCKGPKTCNLKIATKSSNIYVGVSGPRENTCLRPTNLKNLTRWRLLAVGYFSCQIRGIPTQLKEDFCLKLSDQLRWTENWRTVDNQMATNWSWQILEGIIDKIADDTPNKCLAIWLLIDFNWEWWATWREKKKEKVNN